MVKWILLIVLLSGPASAYCGEQIAGSHVFQHDMQCTEGIILHDGVLDCRGHSLSGNREGIGISLQNATVLNCRILRFENGMEIIGEARLENVSLEENIIGLFLEKATVHVKNILVKKNTYYGVYSKNSRIFGKPAFEQNGQDSFSADDFPLQEKPVVRDLRQESNKQIALEKKAILEDKVIRFELHVTALTDITNATLVETIPKELAEDVSQITSATPFIVLEADPVIQFVLGPMQKGEARTIMYRIDRKSLAELSLSLTSVLLVEQKINPQGKIPLRVLSALLIVLLASVSYLKWRLDRPAHHFIEIMLLIAGVIVFLMLDVQIKIILAEWLNNVLVLIILSGAILYLTFQLIHLRSELK